MKNVSPPQINAGSMADIAFLLLVFFLVVTTIDADAGMFRNLASMDEVESQKIHERNILNVWVNKEDKIMIDGKEVELFQVYDIATNFIENPKNDVLLPQKEWKTIPVLGEREVSKQVISIQNDESTSYGQYIAVQNELARAYNHLRDQLSEQEFQMTFEELKKTGAIEKANAIKTIYPMRISEALPIVSTN